jgi:ATP-dependent helicase HrpB
VRALPIDPILPAIGEALRSSRTLVLEAEPGAGKTTRVPVTLLEAGVAGDRRIVVTEPRRLAARLAAGFVASELGEPVGRRVGYSVRFEQAMSDATRVLYVTEGILLRRLVEDPTLADVGAVVLDEFHERHLTTDMLLTLLVRLQRGPRPDLSLVVMSATLDAGPLAAHLGAPRLKSEGRAFPLEIEHEARPDDRPMDRKVASAVKRLMSETTSGDVLVFLPGAREIRQCTEALESEARAGSFALVPLHGDLSVAEQARAVERSSQRRVILSTNVAESSVTIDGVTAVVDAGFARVSGHSPWSGLPTLGTAKISRASATQRAGRAGRTGPGRVIRLYSSGDLATRPEHDKPEILREDLSEAFLSLYGVGVRAPAELAWLDPPPAASSLAAESLLRRLGAIDTDSALTTIGTRMLAFPLPPRLGRVVAEGELRGVAEETALAAALLSERDIRTGARAALHAGGPRGGGVDATGPSDVLELIDRYREAEDARFDPRRLGYMGIDARTARSVERAARQLGRVATNLADRPGSASAVDEAIQIALLAGFPDRIARRKNKADAALTLYSGKTARLAETSVVRNSELMVTLDAEDGAGRGVIVRLASAVTADWLMELYPDMVEMTDELVWSTSNEQVERMSRIATGSVVMDEERKPASPTPEASAVLLQALRARTPAWQDADDRARDLLERLALVRKIMPEAGIPEVATAVVDAALVSACEGRTRLAELKDVDLSAAILSSLSPAHRALVEREAPEHITLPGGRTIPVHYEPGKPPWVESRLQDFFGMTKTPVVLGGRMPLTVHLLAPNMRAVQVTTDLAGFWERHYAGIRRELCRRYPRHSWPDDGKTATPPAPKKR